MPTLRVTSAAGDLRLPFDLRHGLRLEIEDEGGEKFLLTAYSRSKGTPPSYFVAVERGDRRHVMLQGTSFHGEHKLCPSCTAWYDERDVVAIAHHLHGVWTDVPPALQSFLPLLRELMDLAESRGIVVHARPFPRTRWEIDVEWPHEFNPKGVVRDFWDPEHGDFETFEDALKDVVRLLAAQTKGPA